MKRLYWENTYLMQYTARVTEIGQDVHGNWIRLDVTIFHPQGGGQPSDEGTINGIKVTRLVDLRDLNQINHYVEDTSPFKVGDNVELLINKERRLENAALHTAGHITAGILRTEHEYKEQISANHFPKQSKVVFKLDGKSFKKEVFEEQVKNIVSNARKVFEEYDINGTRYITIEGLSSERCSGTHVSSTNEIVDFEIRKIECKKGQLIAGYNAKNRRGNPIDRKQQSDNMNSIQIVKYEKNYQGQVIDLILDIQNNEFNVPVTLSDQPDLENISSFYQQGKGNFWVALSEKKVIGTIALIDIGNSQSALRKMFVAKNFRGKNKGIAQRLLDTVLEWCKLKNIQEIYLGTVSILHAAQRFYEKNGFHEIPIDNLPKNFPIMKVDTKFYVYRWRNHE